MAQLDNKTQFVYEVAFARRELDGLKVNADTKLNDTIEFEIRPPYDIDLLAKRLAHFGKVGDRITEYSRIVSRNQKRSDNQFLTHWYYPYKGKYHPRLVRSIFNILGLEYGQTVLDPFVGSGTTSLEAHLFGLNAIGVDISPVCQIIARVKVTAGQIAQKLPLLREKAVDAMKKDFSEYTKIEPTRKAEAFNSEKDGSSYQQFLDSLKDDKVKDFFVLAQLIFASDLGRRRRDFASFEKNIQTMIASALDLAKTQKELKTDRPLGEVSIHEGDARNLKDLIRDDSVDAVITSPPYSIALNYVYNDRYALEELGIDLAELGEQCIGVKGKGRQKVDLYDEDMRRCYDELYRVLRHGSYCVAVIGEATVDGEHTRNVHNAIEYCERIGFTLKEDLPKKIFGLYNTINDERVLFFEKD
ncbi:MAG: DNA methyltransferase [Thaumarchaeota archaeon]|nr:DNA methyltransferase [Nitrososphaerota archaeon]